ncbi:hypothetical protein DL96DRAFT_1583100 [Flagelloscypha sp. PMI_526]|nr:hypothetical protein DL96DRAFT_1583100 [Flagelloscypha sp. PMI_526]
MSTIGPSLQYLTIYNPNLKPEGVVPEDDEDAEEQAHILFYTSAERAVSRDRMLRQVGLAKALVSFSTMFHEAESSSHIHSQTKRMIMLSPEPNFWIHAGIEISKSTKPPAKGKGKAKSASTFLYHEASVHDVALRFQLSQAYEQFKVTHGSFASILERLGREALELQLERFFTVWAWSWNLDEQPEFSEQFSIPIHPLQSHLTPYMNQLYDDLPEEISSLALIPPYQLVSDRFRQAQFPTSLPRLLASLIPPPPPPSSADKPEHDPTDLPSILSQREQPSRGGTFLGIPPPDQWKWTGYFTIGRGGKANGIPTFDSSGQGDEKTDPLPTPPIGEFAEAVAAARKGQTQTEAVAVNQTALDEAMATDARSAPSPQLTEAAASSAEGQVSPASDSPKPGSNEVSSENELPPQPSADVAGVSETTDSRELSSSDLPDIPGPPDNNSLVESEKNSPPPSTPAEEVASEDPMETPTPSRLFGAVKNSAASSPVSERTILPPELRPKTVHLAPKDRPTETKPQRIYYLDRGGILVAFLGLKEDVERENMFEYAARADRCLKDIQASLEDPDLVKELDERAAKSKQTKERHIVQLSQSTHVSRGFTSKSEHFFNGQQMLEDRVDMDLYEVFSKNQAPPQQWNLSRRGLGIDSRTGEDLGGEVYIEVNNKQATLPDVENLLSATIRRNTLPQ